MSYGKIMLRDPSGRELVEVPRRWADLQAVLLRILPCDTILFSGWPVRRVTRMRLTMWPETAAELVEELEQVMQSPEEEERFRRGVETSSITVVAPDRSCYPGLFDPEDTEDTEDTDEELTHMDIHRDYVSEFQSLCRRTVFHGKWDPAFRQWARGVIMALDSEASSDSERRPRSTPPARPVGRGRALDL